MKRSCDVSMLTYWLPINFISAVVGGGDVAEIDAAMVAVLKIIALLGGQRSPRLGADSPQIAPLRSLARNRRSCPMDRLASV
jgi:hypothetical protein